MSQQLFIVQVLNNGTSVIIDKTLVGVIDSYKKVHFNDHPS